MEIVAFAGLAQVHKRKWEGPGKALPVRAVGLPVPSGDKVYPHPSPWPATKLFDALCTGLAENLEKAARLATAITVAGRLAVESA